MKELLADFCLRCVTIGYPRATKKRPVQLKRIMSKNQLLAKKSFNKLTTLNDGYTPNKEW